MTIFPNAVLYENTIVGAAVRDPCQRRAGRHGFGYRFVDGRHVPARPVGQRASSAADVEIGAGTTIDRGTYGPTVIGDGTKIDNLVMIAHNCRIGRHNMICSQVGIAGSTTTGDYVVMAGQVGVRDHVHIGDGAVLGAKAGVSNDVPDGAALIGIPATPEREQKIQFAAISQAARDAAAAQGAAAGRSTSWRGSGQSSAQSAARGLTHGQRRRAVNRCERVARHVDAISSATSAAPGLSTSSPARRSA